MHHAYVRWPWIQRGVYGGAGDRPARTYTRSPWSKRVEKIQEARDDRGYLLDQASLQLLHCIACTRLCLWFICLYGDHDLSAGRAADRSRTASGIHRTFFCFYIYTTRYCTTLMRQVNIFRWTHFRPFNFHQVIEKIDDGCTRVFRLSYDNWYENLRARRSWD